MDTLFCYSCLKHNDIHVSYTLFVVNNPTYVVYCLGCYFNVKSSGITHL